MLAISSHASGCVSRPSAKVGGGRVILPPSPKGGAMERRKVRDHEHATELLDWHSLLRSTTLQATNSAADRDGLVRCHFWWSRLFVAGRLPA